VGTLPRGWYPAPTCLIFKEYIGVPSSHIFLWGYQFKTLRGSNFQMNFLKKIFSKFCSRKTDPLFFDKFIFDFKNLGSKKYGKVSPLRKPY
jgi:hypothetical protein